MFLPRRTDLVPVGNLAGVAQQVIPADVLRTLPNSNVRLGEHHQLKSVTVKSVGLTAVSACCVLAGLLGLSFGDIALHASRHVPVWAWPAVLLASIVLIVIGAVLVPAAIRITRTSERGRQA